MFTQYRIPKRPKYTNDEIKLHIKRFEKRIIKLENQYKTALLKENELLSKPHTVMDVVKCRDEYGNYKLIKSDINYLKRTIQKLNDILNEEV